MLHPLCRMRHELNVKRGRLGINECVAFYFDSGQRCVQRRAPNAASEFLQTVGHRKHLCQSLCPGFSYHPGHDYGHVVRSNPNRLGTLVI